jgi:glycosyltransferase involved in cell wall biosynthesis
MAISVIISTYNHPKWLEKTLWGYQLQSFKDFEVIIADDGSDEETKNVITAAQAELDFPIKHAWHEDNGFQKSVILNKATLLTENDYLVFTDGDCIPHPEFLATHMNLSAQGRFLSGGYCKLPMDLSRLITKDDIQSGRVFDVKWLKKYGKFSGSSKRKLGFNAPFSAIADKFTTTKPTWNGCNSSTWRKNIIEVNGHNEEMQYGGQDREMGERLLNLGLKPMQIRHQAVLLHLDHKRGYKTQESIDKNLKVRAETKQSGVKRTPHGIEQL